jgi:beta-galactosidase
MAVSEYGAGGGISQHSDNINNGLVSAIGGPHPEEFESDFHEKIWKQLNQRPYLFATWVWNMFDFASDMRQEGDSIDLNDKGLVRFDHKTKKDAFYFYQASWSGNPVLHLNGTHYRDRSYPTTYLSAYTNASSAMLTINGRAAGSVDCENHTCAWPDVRLDPGNNTVVVSASINGNRLTEQAMLTAPTAADGIHINAGDVVVATTTAGVRLGSDNFVSGGSPRRLNLPMRGGGAGKVVSGEDDPALYDAFREGQFTYRVPVANGRYAVTIHTFEPSASQADKRTFLVKIDGKVVLEKFSPARAAGGVLKTFAKSFVVDAKDGAVSIDFVPEAGDALLAALDVAPLTSGRN